MFCLSPESKVVVGSNSLLLAIYNSQGHLPLPQFIHLNYRASVAGFICIHSYAYTHILNRQRKKKVHIFMKIALQCICNFYFDKFVRPTFECSLCVMLCAGSTQQIDRIHATQRNGQVNSYQLRTSVLQLEDIDVKSCKLNRAFSILAGTWKMFHVTAVQVLKVGVTKCDDGSILNRPY